MDFGEQPREHTLAICGCVMCANGMPRLGSPLIMLVSKAMFVFFHCVPHHMRTSGPSCLSGNRQWTHAMAQGYVACTYVLLRIQ